MRALGFAFLGGERPQCLDACDANASGTLDVTNGVYFFNPLFLGRRPLSPPVDECDFALPLLGCDKATEGCPDVGVIPAPGGGS